MEIQRDIEKHTLYVLGDILDRGPHPIQIILKLMEMPNVVCLTGNHELMALECLEFLMQEITEISIEKVDEKMLENLVTWQHNGSKSTIDEFRALSREMQYEVIEFIKDFMIYEELKVNGRDYLLVHGGLGNYYPGKEIEEYSLKELIWDRAEYDIQYFEDTYVVTGHTPTQGIMGNLRPGYVYRENHHIAIDYITGDCHALFDKLIWLARFNKKLKKEDVIILLGDVGLNYFGVDKDQENKKILADFPNYFLCIHGNHEERPYHIQTYRTQIWHGGEVYYEPEFPNIVFAKDGEIYDFDGKKAIVIGGAYSQDKEYRLSTGLPWFPDEQPDDKVKSQVENKLNEVDWKIDYVFSHTCPLVYRPSQESVINFEKIDLSTEEWMDEIAKKLDYSQWYFGHYHDNIQYTDAQLLYEEIKELGEPDSVQKVGRPRYRVGEMVYFTFGKEDAREGYGTVEWVDNYGTLGQEKEVSYDIVGIPCELPGEKTLFMHIRESKIQSIDEMEIVKIEREEG